jgi:prephenate dehydrogenase
MTTVALLGYGRFGAALGALLREADVNVRAFDEGAHVPEEVRAGSVEELARGADVVVVAVPVPAMHGAFEALRPHVGKDQIVVDVGSVKTGPARAMAEVFGDAVPWVATHPLFGPVSLSRGERPLVAIVCPNPMHPEATRAVASLYARIGCLVVEQDVDAHDRAMAWTHALAFFVAKGMLDAGVPVDAPHAPPSFQALARVVEAARADAGHLLTALHRENPHAAEARARLLAALTAADANLSITPAGTTAQPIDLPAPEGPSPALQETRTLIDEVDREIVALLSRRARLSMRAAREKARLGQPVRDPAREAQLVAARRRWAEEKNLSPDAVSAIFEAILRWSRRIQGEPEGEP